MLIEIEEREEAGGSDGEGGGELETKDTQSRSYKEVKLQRNEDAKNEDTKGNVAKIQKYKQAGTQKSRRTAD